MRHKLTRASAIIINYITIALSCQFVDITSSSFGLRVIFSPLALVTTASTSDNNAPISISVRLLFRLFHKIGNRFCTRARRCFFLRRPPALGGPRFHVGSETIARSLGSPIGTIYRRISPATTKARGSESD